MVNSELKIDDDFVNSMSSLLSEWTSDLQTGTDQYLEIIDAIIEDAIMEGDTAEALKSFASYAQYLQTIISEIGSEVSGLCINFIQEVDAKDSYLY